MDEKGSELKVYPGLNKTEITAPKEITLSVDGKSTQMIEREVRDAYMQNFTTINIVGSDLTKYASTIRSVTQNLMALELMEQTSKKASAKDFMNIKEVSVEGLMRKIDLNVRGMLSDAIRTETEAHYTEILNRDESVNKLCFLLFRAIKQALTDPVILKHFNVSELEMFDIFKIVYQLEKIADDSKRLSKNLYKSDLSAEERKKLKELHEEVEKFYLETLKVHYTKNGLAAFQLAEKKDELMRVLDSNFDLNQNAPRSMWAGILIENLKEIVLGVHSIARVAYKYKYENT